MGFWKKVKGLFQLDKTGDWKGQGYDFENWNGHIFGGLYNSGLATNEMVFSVVTRLANTISSLPIHLYKDYDRQNSNLSDLLSVAVNDSMSSFEFFQKTETSRDTDGNGYALIGRDKYGKPTALYPLKPGSCSPAINRDDNTLWYQITDDDVIHAVVFNTEVIHVKHISANGSLKGISPLRVLRKTLDFNDAVQKFSLTEMSKDDSYIIKYDRNVSPEKRAAMIADFTKMVKEHGGAVLQEKGFDYDRFARDFNSADLKDTESITLSRIANAYNVPLSFLNQTTNTSTSNEQLMIQFVQMTLMPIVKQYEAEFNRKLLTEHQREQGYYFKFNMNGLLRGDTSARTALYQAMIRNGAASPNDISKLEDIPPSDLPNADKRFVSGDLYPVDMDPALRKTSAKGGDGDGKETKVPDDQTEGKDGS